MRARELAYQLTRATDNGRFLRAEVEPMEESEGYQRDWQVTIYYPTDRKVVHESRVATTLDVMRVLSHHGFFTNSTTLTQTLGGFRNARK